jgi:outer membrane protein TolC
MARQAWAGALARYHQVVSLDDPTLSLALAPGSVFGDAPRPGAQIQLSQRIPFPGRLDNAGEIAIQNALAYRGDLEELKLELAARTLAFYFEYYALARSLEINARHQALLQEIRESAASGLATGRSSPQDPLQAEVELARLERQRLSLAARSEIVRSSLNELLHRHPGAFLPEPLPSLPTEMPVALQRSDVHVAALSEHPALNAARSRLSAREAGVRLAHLLSWPDIGIMASYNSLMQLPEYRYLLGVSVQLPIRVSRREAAVEQADAEVAAARSAYRLLESRILLDADRAWQRLEESRSLVQLYRQTLLPVSRDQLEAARTGFTAGQNDFIPLIDSERNLRTAELEFQLALATLHQRGAELQLSMGRIPGIHNERNQP